MYYTSILIFDPQNHILYWESHLEKRQIAYDGGSEAHLGRSSYSKENWGSRQNIRKRHIFQNIESRISRSCISFLVRSYSSYLEFDREHLCSRIHLGAEVGFESWSPSEADIRSGLRGDLTREIYRSSGGVPSRSGSGFRPSEQRIRRCDVPFVGGTHNTFSKTGISRIPASELASG
jgi:hypothetical protein